MANTVRILKFPSGWHLIIGGQSILEVKTLYDAIEAANLLMVHIANVDELPLQQYKTAA